MAEIRSEGERECDHRGRKPTAAAAMNGGEKLAGGTSFDVPGHHRAREDHGKQEKLEASSMDGSEGATMAQW